MANDAPTRRRYHLNGTFVVFSLLTLLLALGAFNSNNNLLFWLFGLALSLIVVSGLVSGSMLMGVSIRRLEASPGTAGGPMLVRYAVRNANRLVPIFALRITERSGGGQPRVLAFAACVPAGRTRVIEGIALSDTRGRFALNAFEAATSFPFGIIRKSLLFDQPGRLVVRPAAADPGPLPVPPDRSGHQAEAERLVRDWRSWSGEERLAGVREYAAGDPPGRVAWRASSRALAEPLGRDPLLVKHHWRLPSRTRRVVIDLDLAGARSDAEYEGLISRALGAARRLCAGAQGRDVHVGLRVSAAGAFARPQPGASAVAEVLTDLPRFGDQRGWRAPSGADLRGCVLLPYPARGGGL